MYGNEDGNAERLGKTKGFSVVLSIKPSKINGMSQKIHFYSKDLVWQCSTKNKVTETLM